MIDVLSLIARVCLAALFLAAGVQKIFGYDGITAYMTEFGVPVALLPAVIALQLSCGLAILTGFFARPAALALAVFSLAAALIFHRNFSDGIQVAMFMKNIAIAGGLLLLAAHGPGRFAVRA